MQVFNVILYYMVIFFRPPPCVVHRATNLGDHKNPFQPQNQGISASSPKTHQLFSDYFVSLLVIT